MGIRLLNLKVEAYKNLKKMSARKNPNSKNVLKNLEDLPRVGILSQSNEGMIYLDLDDDWIFKALEVLKDYGYIRPPFFVFPPTPVGAHIKIITKREAEDYELTHSDVEIPRLGEEFGFKVKKAFVSRPRTRRFGIDTRYVIRVEIDSDLMKIRRDLTGKRTPVRNGFNIVVGITNPVITKAVKEPNFDEIKYEASMNKEEKEKKAEKEDEEDFGKNSKKRN